ncbi:spermidine synthase [Capsaspora owczarzaki ATCC 30864]|uniref:Spermidine synthase n=1 Tax=Capsaspora owczarzaki (strain ATCC 30864) TaxID=595528 RepID=A0A0D2WRW3_CAPO3|nr:spermidine synthase [Capsaspora owczarzaki ATCC 30864]KJE94058.1 spermidine synthase [Capsaspora owczarzaki ATCC 30864]|eukprot:XP_011270457.1 spermidine synthase [Capsaspora owczarzaki ATCC 30864]
MTNDSIQDGWFTEKSDLWPGQGLALKVKQVLHHAKSDFQDILVFQSESYGNVLVLDGAVQVTERDEFAYQEMIAHLPLCIHPYPKSVLIVGGGDGGVIREVIKHQAVEHITLCEIDPQVIEVAKKYLPSLAVGFNDPRVTVHVGDGVEYMKQHAGNFDVIITDSSDPIGPASALFEQPFYAAMRNALKPNGIVCTQAESIWLHLDLICNMKRFCSKLFPVVGYAWTSIPTYPCGQIGFMICSLNPLTELEQPTRSFSDTQLKSLPLRYYNKRIHTSSFTLPQFAQVALDAVDNEPEAVAASQAATSHVTLLRERESAEELANRRDNEDAEDEESEQPSEKPEQVEADASTDAS